MNLKKLCKNAFDIPKNVGWGNKISSNPYKKIRGFACFCSEKFCQGLPLNSLTKNETIEEKNSQKSATWKATKRRNISMKLLSHMQVQRNI